MIFYGLVIVGASFFTCMTHPGSVWYTPFICNALGVFVGIFGALDDPSFPTNFSFWIVVGAYLLISVVASIIGARKGSHLDNKA